MATELDSTVVPSSDPLPLFTDESLLVSVRAVFQWLPPQVTPPPQL